MHSSDGNLASDINTLTGNDPAHPVSVHYYVARDGTVHHFVNDNDIAYDVGATTGPLAHLNNQTTIGIEQEHIDRNPDGSSNPYPDAQVRGAASLAASLMRRYPNLTINDFVGHSQVAPERKQDPYNYPWDKFRQYAQEDLGQAPAAAVAQAPGAPRAEPSTKLASGFYGNEDPKSFDTGKATTFATPDDIKRFYATNGAEGDNGRGAAKLGGINTADSAGIAIPYNVAVQKFGTNAANWRTARVDVVDPATGQRLRLPIVDFGPGAETGALIDMTPFVSNYFGGDKNLSVKLVAGAGPDITKNPQAWADEQAAIKGGIDTSSVVAGAARVAPKQNYTLGSALSPAYLVALQQAQSYKVQSMRDTLAALPEAQSGNAVGLYKRLSNPVDGVNNAFRQNYQNALKAEITKEAQQFYGIQDPGQAFTKATSDVNFGDVAGDLTRAAAGHMGSIDLAIMNAGQQNDANRVDQILARLHPDSSPEQRALVIKHLTSPDLNPTDRFNLIRNEITIPFSQLDPQIQAAYDLPETINAFERLSDPRYQQAQTDAINTKRAWIANQLASDPRLKGTFMDKVIQTVSPIPQQTLLALSGPLAPSLITAQVHSDAYESIRSEHPDWSEAQVKGLADKSTLYQLAPQGVLTLLHSGQLGEFINGVVGGGLGRRIIGNAAVHVGGGVGVGAAQQALANVAEGRPVGQGVVGAALAGGVQGLPGAAMGVFHGAPENVPQRTIRQEPVAEPVREQPPPAVPVTEERPAVQGPPAVPITEERPPVQPPQAPVTQEDVARRAYEISQERASTGAPGDPLSDWARAQQELSQASAPPGPVTQGESEPWVSAIANKFTAERMASGELGPVAPGQGASTEALLARGLRMGPEEVAQHVSDVMNNRGGDPVAQAAAIRAAEAQLSQRSNAASRAAEADPTNQQLKVDADNAFKDLTDFHNGPVAKLKNDFHLRGMGLQGEIPVDLSTLNGLKELFLKEIGKPPPDSMENVLRNAAKRVSDAADVEKTAMQKMGTEIERQTVGIALPTPEQVRLAILSRMKVDPC
jgi:hypothetical protein